MNLNEVDSCNSFYLVVFICALIRTVDDEALRLRTPNKGDDSTLQADGKVCDRSVRQIIYPVCWMQPFTKFKVAKALIILRRAMVSFLAEISIISLESMTLRSGNNNEWEIAARYVTLIPVFRSRYRSGSVNRALVAASRGHEIPRERQIFV